MPQCAGYRAMTVLRDAGHWPYSISNVYVIFKPLGTWVFFTCICTYHRNGPFRVFILFNSPDIDQNATVSRRTLFMCCMGSFKSFALNGEMNTVVPQKELMAHRIRFACLKSELR
jgi:hypothetical protein